MRYTIENDELIAEISDLGATLTRLIDKKSGTDVVLGFNEDDDYRRNAGNNIGATIGRNANRIGEARFSLNGIVYQLSVNDNMNQLHGGGINGFAFKTWKLEELKTNQIDLSYYSPDGEEGFPGNLQTRVSYALKDDSLIFTFSGEADRDTIFNITNHSYFNLGDEDILNEYLHVTSDVYAPCDEYSLTLPETHKVASTAYDFREFTRIGDNLQKVVNIDNNYVWENLEDKLLCELKNDKLQLNVYSDLPDMHVYTAYYLDTDTGKQGKPYGKFEGIALEAQYYPNSINYRGYLQPILKKGEKMTHYIRYELKRLKED